jgi:hypothetical protein
MRGEVRRGRGRRISLGPRRKEENPRAEEHLEIHSRVDSSSRNSWLCRRTKRGPLTAKRPAPLALSTTPMLRLSVIAIPLSHRSQQSFRALTVWQEILTLQPVMC